MRIIRSGLLFLLIGFVAHSAHAGPCDTLLCMTGKLQGQSGGIECNQPIADYFNIIEYGKHWRFDPSATAAARLGFLNSCQAPGIGDWPTKINAAYGTIL